MATDVLMPALSPTMEEGTLAKWLVKEGDTVSSGDILAEIETDKATMEFEAVDEGIIGKILVAEGTENVKVNTPIAILVEEGESVDDAAPAPTAAAEPAPAVEAPAPAAAAPAAPVVDASPDWPEGTAMKQQKLQGGKAHYRTRFSRIKTALKPLTLWLPILLFHLKTG